MSLTRKQIRIRAMKSLGAYIQVTPDANADGGATVISAATLQDTAFDDEKYEGWFVENDLADVAVAAAPYWWRMVASTTVSSNGDITLTRALPGVLAPLITASSDTLHFYAYLSPDEINDCIDMAMQDRFRRVQVAIPLEEGTREYNITAHADWLVSKKDIIRVRVRNTDDGADQYFEEEQAILRLFDDDGETKIYLPEGTPTSYDLLIVEARRYYREASNDDTIYVGVPDRLAVLSAKHEILKNIFQKVGPGAKRWFGMAMVTTERELTEQEQRHLDTSAERDWSTEEVPSGGMDSVDSYGSWY